VEPATLVDVLRGWARARPRAPAYTWLRDGDEPERTLSFGELDRAARRVAAELEARGLAGGRALLLQSPGLEFVIAFLGCLYARVVAVPMNTPRNERALGTMLAIARHAAPGIVLTDAATHERVATAAPAFGGLEILRTDALPETSGADWRPGPIGPEALAFLQYTSGSTGAPKGVEVTHGNLMRNEEMIRDAFAHDERTVFVGWLPLFHDMGLVGNVLQPLFLGVPCVLMAPAAFVQRPVRWLRAISRHGGTTSGSPNFGYELCARKVRAEELEGLDLSSWRVAYNGSEPIRAETLERFLERFAPLGFRREALYPCYGMAEASLFVTGGVAAEPFRTLDVAAEALLSGRIETAAAPGAETRRLVSCGRPWRDQVVRVVDPETRVPVAAGRVGEIWIQGGNVARGYRAPGPGGEDSFAARLGDGEGPYFRTGDLGFLADGELYVTGRSKDLLILRGENHYPQDLEAAAGASHPLLRADHAAAFTSEEDGDCLVLVVEVHRRHHATLEGDPQARAAVVGAVRHAVAQQHGLQVWRVVLIAHGSLPRTSSGKVQRRLCRDSWRAGTLQELGRGSRGGTPDPTLSSAPLLAVTRREAARRSEILP